jgi:hypothetical protein
MEHSLYGLDSLGTPTAEPTKPQSPLRAPLTAKFPLMLRGAGDRPTALTIFGDQDAAQNAVRGHVVASPVAALAFFFLGFRGGFGLGSLGRKVRFDL